MREDWLEILEKKKADGNVSFTDATSSSRKITQTDTQAETEVEVDRGKVENHSQAVEGEDTLSLPLRHDWSTQYGTRNTYADWVASQHWDPYSHSPDAGFSGVHDVAGSDYREAPPWPEGWYGDMAARTASQPDKFDTLNSRSEDNLQDSPGFWAPDWWTIQLQ